MRKRMEKVADNILKESQDEHSEMQNAYMEYLKSLFVKFFGGLEDEVGEFTSSDLRKAFESALDYYTVTDYRFRERSL